MWMLVESEGLFQTQLGESNSPPWAMPVALIGLGILA
jgi:hypothetical protein